MLGKAIGLRPNLLHLETELGIVNILPETSFETFKNINFKLGQKVSKYVNNVE